MASPALARRLPTHVPLRSGRRAASSGSASLSPEAAEAAQTLLPAIPLYRAVLRVNRKLEPELRVMGDGCECFEHLASYACFYDNTSALRSVRWAATHWNRREERVPTVPLGHESWAPHRLPVVRARHRSLAADTLVNGRQGVQTRDHELTLQAYVDSIEIDPSMRTPPSRSMQELTEKARPHRLRRS